MRSDRSYRRVILALVVLLGASLGALCALLARYNLVSQYAPLAEMADTIEKHFYYYDAEAGEQALIDASLRGMVASLGDVYAEYYTKEEYDALLADQSGEYVGIGILIAEPDAAGARIDRVYPDSPMERAGALAGDYIVAVNGTETANLTLDELLLLFFDDEDRPDDLSLLRGGERFAVTVRKELVYTPYVSYEMLDGGIGYVQIESFHGNVVGEMETALASLLESGMQSLILDLRDNPGGGLTQVLDVADMFLKKGDTIVSIKSKTEDTRTYFAEEDGYAFPMAVLVNGNSASASELLTGALKYNGRAAIIGTRTFGKGIVQTTYRLNSNAGWVKITTDAYYSPNDICIQDVGIAPDIPVEPQEEYRQSPITAIPRESDAQLQEAIRYLKG